MHSRPQGGKRTTNAPFSPAPCSPHDLPIPYPINNSVTTEHATQALSYLDPQDEQPETLQTALTCDCVVLSAAHVLEVGMLRAHTRVVKPAQGLTERESECCVRSWLRTFPPTMLIHETSFMTQRFQCSWQGMATGALRQTVSVQSAVVRQQISFIVTHPAEME